jgi:hypothetical protein
LAGPVVLVGPAVIEQGVAGPGFGRRVGGGGGDAEQNGREREGESKKRFHVRQCGVCAVFAFGALLLRVTTGC